MGDSMSKQQSRRRITAVLALSLAPCWSWAADHADAPSSALDPSADITDIFVFREGGRLVGAICFGGAPVPRARVDGPTGRYDPNVLFSYEIDLNGDAQPEHEILIRYGRNAKGEAGVQFENLPGAGAKFVSGPVEKVISAPSGLRVYTGLRDDPFFFDFVGFTATLASFNSSDKPKGTLMFDNARDSFAFRNLTAIVFEMDPTLVVPEPGKLVRVWATANRLVGSSP